MGPLIFVGLSYLGCTVELSTSVIQALRGETVNSKTNQNSNEENWNSQTNKILLQN